MNNAGDGGKNALYVTFIVVCSNLAESQRNFPDEPALSSPRETHNENKSGSKVQMQAFKAFWGFLTSNALQFAQTV